MSIRHKQTPAELGVSLKENKERRRIGKGEVAEKLGKRSKAPSAQQKKHIANSTGNTS
jgi:hypothetical protein